MEARVKGECVEFHGFLNERTLMDPLKEAVLQAAKNAGANRIRLDFSPVEKANSCGILAWLKMFKEISVKVTYVNAPIWLVEQINSITEFLVHDSLVESFYARFYCADDDTLCTKLLQLGTDIPEMDDYSDFEFDLKTDDGKVLEPDFDPPGYLAFVARIRARKQGGSK